jgi:hypothetical protein
MSTKSTVEPLLVSIADAAALLNKCRAEIYLAIGRGDLVAVKDGRRTKLTMESCRAFAASRKPASIKPARVRAKAEVRP